MGKGIGFVGEDVVARVSVVEDEVDVAIAESNNCCVDIFHKI